MSHRQIIWDRTKLYDEVWEKPTVHLAKEYGISDVGLGKVCRQLNIPKLTAFLGEMITCSIGFGGS